MIKIKNLKVDMKSFAIAFKDYNFKKNKITIIAGRNGSGKTTLLRALANLLNYTGSIEFGGTITYNSQEPVIFDKTVFNNIAYPLKIRKLNIDEYEHKIIKYCELLNIDDLLHKNALKLSSGEKMKVSIIRSIIFSPDVVLLDEPTTHLDLESIDELTMLLKELKNKMTFIIVTHNKTFMDQLKDYEYKIGA